VGLGILIPKEKVYDMAARSSFAGMWYGLLLSTAFTSFLLISGAASAYGLEGITVTRTGPSSVPAGGDVNVTIVVESSVNDIFSVTVEEQLTGSFVSSDGELVQQREPLYRPDFIRWEFLLLHGERKELQYVTKAQFPGDMIFIPTAVYLENWSDLGHSFTEPDYLEVSVLCNANGMCEADEGEDYITCPDDCTTGIGDDNCDLVEDGRCDPDCEAGYDPDCSTGAVIGGDLQGSIILIAVAAALLVIAAISAFLVIRRRKQNPLKHAPAT
jgi:hypothetical protein